MIKFLVGTWKTSGGGYNFTIYEEGDRHRSHMNTANYPDGDYYFFINGVYCVGDTEETAKEYLDFYIENKNTVYVINCRTGEEFYMYRQ